MVKILHVRTGNKNDNGAKATIAQWKEEKHRNRKQWSLRAGILGCSKSHKAYLDSLLLYAYNKLPFNKLTYFNKCLLFKTEWYIFLCCHLCLLYKATVLSLLRLFTWTVSKDKRNLKISFYSLLFLQNYTTLRELVLPCFFSMITNNSVITTQVSRRNSTQFHLDFLIQSFQPMGLKADTMTRIPCKLLIGTNSSKNYLQRFKEIHINMLSTIQ